MSVDLTNLTTYVEENKSGLIKKAVIGAKSASLFNLMVGVKGTTALNLLNTSVVFGNGKTCGWSEDTGTTQEISQRNIVPGFVKVNTSFCDAAMADYFMNNQVKIAAGTEVLPFEEAFTSDITNKIASNLEKAIWNGDTNSANNNLKQFDGLFKILTAASGETVNPVIATGDTIFEVFNKVYSNIPVEILDSAVILCGADTFRTLVMYLTSQNLYNYAPSVDGTMEIILPGTSTKVIALNGMNGSKKIVATYLDNIFYGTDLMGDEEVYKLWYSDDNQIFRLAVKFTAGVQVAFPDMIVVAAHN
jgi:hypothetical protein